MFKSVWSPRLARISLALLLAGASARAQFVAFNDSAPGAGTAANATRWDIFGNSPGASGALKDINSGAVLPVTVTITRSGTVVASGGAGAPAAGTPLYDVFDGYVDFPGAGDSDAAAQVVGSSTVTYTFTGLSPNKIYSFKGGAVRAGSGGDYALRWSLFQINGAVSFLSEPTAGCYTNGLAINQVAVNTGVNTNGDLADWENITVAANGSFSVVTTQYSGPIPGGGTASGPYGYALSGFRLEESTNATTAMAPIPAIGYNRDVVIESTATGPPFSNAAGELNPGEGNGFYQSGLPGYAGGLPASGSFISAVNDATVFQFQPFTGNNALVLSSETGIGSGTLTIANQVIYSRFAVIANSANGDLTGLATVTFNFSDGSAYSTNYYAPDWFNAPANVALGGVDRIEIDNGALQNSGTGNPRFYQTTINLAALGVANKPLAGVTFGRAAVSSSTAIYAISGIVSGVAPQIPAAIVTQPANLTVFQLAPASFSVGVAGNPIPSIQWYSNDVVVPGATNLTITLASTSLNDNGDAFRAVVFNVVSNVTHSVTSSVATLTVNAIALPIAATGYNADVIIENTAAGPPYTGAAVELNPGEGNAFYQSGLPGTSLGVPLSGRFFSAVDGTVFQFQPYTNKNVLVMSANTGIGAGTLTLTAPAIYSRIALIANSASGGGSSGMTLQFTDGTTFTTNYSAPDWFNNNGYALSGVERINVSNGALSGNPGNPRFYQTTLDLDAVFGYTNKPMAAITFTQASSSGATGVYALSGIVAPRVPVIILGPLAPETVTELAPAAFAANVGGSPFPTVQWYQNGTAIPNATNALYSIPQTPLSDNGALFQFIAANVVSNVSYSVTSQVARLTVLADTTPPVLRGAQSLGLTRVQLSFSKRITPATATNPANYSISGTNGTVAIASAALDASQTNVILSVAALADQALYTATVNHLSDQTAAGNVIAANSQTAFTASIFTPVAIGNPLPAGGQTILTNGLNVVAGGTGIGGVADQFQFSSRQVAGNFDVAVRVAGLGLTTDFAQAGLMAREALAPGGRFAASMTTPAMNGSSFLWRNPANAAASSAGGFPANFPNTWLRLSRVGNLFTGFASYDGQTWTAMGSQTITMSNSVYLGLAVSSDTSTQATTAQFVGPVIVTNAITGTVPYPYEPPASCSRNTPITISEIMYKPAARTDNQNVEYVELYNSNPWFADISSYQIICADMNYAFPPNTIITGGGYLVVAASPGGIQNVYGITNVMGPYNGSLKKSETLQLFDEHGALLLTVPYTDTFPWPVAAAGTGHSIFLANPSYGEGDPRAWAISDAVGGSPGQRETFHPSPLRSVVINEVLPHSENAAVPQFIELYNHSNQGVDVSGCIVTDDPAVIKFVIPAGTVIGPGGFVSFTLTQLGFDLNGAGETLFFIKPDGSRILDAVQFSALADGVSFGRWPDGANDFYALQALSPGTNNSAITIGTIVINELMYDPISGNQADQYVELFNQGTNAVNLANWQFTSGVTFTFPANTVIPANGYLVLAADVTNLLAKYTNLNGGNTVGNFGGKLSHNGERVALSQPVSYYGTNTIYVVEDEVTYGTGGRWGNWSSGGGSSLELIDPRSNHRLAANWTDSDDSQKSAWTDVETTGVLDNGGNYESSILHAQIGLLDVGECLVDNIEVDYQNVNYVINSTFESGLANWSMQGSHVRSSLENSGYNSSHSLHIRCGDKFWTGENSCEATLNANAMAAGATATLRYKARWIHGNPEPDLRLNGNWLEATAVLPIPANLGTPGLPNSAFTANAGPALYQVTHTPPLPAAGQSVVVSACVHDPDGVQGLVLHYRIDPNTTYTTVAMSDSGLLGDALAHDGIFSATIPGRPANTIVAFYVTATDSRGAATRFPALTTDNAPVRECVVMFGDGNPGGSFGVYHMWLTQANVNRWAGLADLSNEGNDFTFVYDNNRVVYNVQGHYSGSPYHQEFDTPVGNLCAYKWIFPGDDKFLGATDFNKLHQPGNSPGDDASQQREQTSWTFHRALGVPWGYRRFVAVYANGNRRGVLMEDAQVPDSDMVKEYFPDDSDGFLYKLQPWFEFAPAPSGSGIGTGTESDCYFLPYRTTGNAFKTARYRYNFEVRRTLDSFSDYTNLFSLVTAMGASANPNYVANLENLADMENWMRFFAANHACGNLDAIGCQVAQNTYVYMGAGGTKFTFIPWDINIDLGGPQSWGPGQNLFYFDGNDTTIAAIYSNPTFLRMYWRAMQELINGPLDVNQTTGWLMNAKYNAFVANGLTVENPNSAILPWIAQARISIASQLAAVNATNFAVNPTVAVTNNEAYISGTAPVNVDTIWVNGAARPLTWNTLTNWTVVVPLGTGTNILTVLGVDLHHQLVPGAINRVSAVFNGTLASAVGKVVINEIMYAAAAPEAQFVELFNNSINTAFDLSSWTLQGPGYTFPAGSVIAPRSFLVLAANRASFAAAYGATIPVFDTFASTLPASGATLALVKPGASNVTVAAVHYQPPAPWPTNSGAPAMSLQLVDAAQDNWRAGNWTAGVPTPGAVNAGAASLPVFPPLWINELQPNNLTGITNSAGQRTPWLELYNPTTNTVSLNGLFLANDDANTNAWNFPANAVINPGQFKVIFADGATSLSVPAELHTAFTLSNSSGFLALSRVYDGKIQTLDFVDYAGIVANYSYGSLPDGQSFNRQQFFFTTPGAPNNGGGLPPYSYIDYSIPGAIYAQNFDSLPNPGAASVNSGNPVTIAGVTYSLANPFDFSAPVSATGSVGGMGNINMAGWYGLANPSASVGTRFGATDGDQTTGGDISFGDPNSPDRALGLLATSSTGFTAFGAKFLNSTAGTLNYITLNYTGEVWRQSNVAKVLQFYYFIDPAATNAFSTSYTGLVPALNVTIPTVAADVGGLAVDGTLAANQRSLGVTNLAIAPWAPGAALWLVWEMSDASGKAQGLAIDDLSFSALAELPLGPAPALGATFSGGNLVLSWPTISGQKYQVEFTANLASGVWIPVGSPISGTGSPVDRIDNPSADQGYYRLTVSH